MKTAEKLKELGIELSDELKDMPNFHTLADRYFCSFDSVIDFMIHLYGILYVHEYIDLLPEMYINALKEYNYVVLESENKLHVFYGD